MRVETAPFVPLQVELQLNAKEFYYTGGVAKMSESAQEFRPASVAKIRPDQKTSPSVAVYVPREQGYIPPGKFGPCRSG